MLSPKSNYCENIMFHKDNTFSQYSNFTSDKREESSFHTNPNELSQEIGTLESTLKILDKASFQNLPK